MKNAIITVATKKGNYAQGLARLSDSLRNNFDGDFLAWMHERALRAPLHAHNPYAFKVHAFLRAFDMGYDNVLWLDCSAYAVQNVAPIFEEIADKGHFFQEAGHLLGEWSNDRLLDYFGFTRDQAMEIPMVMGGIIGLRKGSFILDELQAASGAEVFKGAWDNTEKTESLDERCKGHRHEMSAVSAIAHKNGITWSQQCVQYGSFFDKTLETTLIKFQGL